MPETRAETVLQKRGPPPPHAISAFRATQGADDERTDGRRRTDGRTEEIKVQPGLTGDSYATLQADSLVVTVAVASPASELGADRGGRYVLLRSCAVCHCEWHTIAVYQITPLCVGGHYCLSISLSSSECVG